MRSSKDGNWLKWIILAVGFYIYTFVFSIPFGFGSLLNAIQDNFHQNLSATAAVQAILVGVTLSTGIFSGMFISRFGLWRISLLGSILLPLGFSLSYFADSIVHLYVCISVISGIGVSILFIGSLTCIGRTFSGSKRLLVLAIQNTGLSVGVTLLPYILDFLLETYGLNGTFLIMGGFYMNCIPVVRMYAIVGSGQVNSPNIARATVDEQEHLNVQEYVDKENCVHNDPEFNVEMPTSSPTCFVTFKQEIKQLVRHIKVVMNVPFTLSMLSIGVIMGSLNGYFVLVVDILQWKGFTSSQALLAFPLTYGLGFIARLLPGIIKQFISVNSFVLPIVFSLCGLLGQVVMCNSTNLPIDLVGCGLSGLAISGTASCANIVTVQLVGNGNIAIGLGLVYTSIGILSTLSGPAYGAIRDRTQSYTLVLYLTAGFQLIGCVLFLVTFVIRKKQSKRKSYPMRSFGSLVLHETEQDV